MYDLITIGTVSIDLYYTGESLTYSKDHFEFAIGGKYFAEGFYEHLGGGATNVAIGVKRAGMKTALMAKIGNNSFKKLILHKLEEEDISYANFCQFENDYINISSIFLTESGEKTLINYRSPHQHFFEELTDLSPLIKSKAIYVANLPSVPLDQRIGILRFAHKNNVMTCLNLGVVDCRRDASQIEDLLRYVDILIINAHECADLIKQPYHKLNFRKNIVEEFLPYFMSQTLVITDGEKGSYAYQGQNVFFQQAISPTRIVDATGAGDAYTAGFIAAFLQMNDIPRAMHSAAKYSAKILAKIGAN